MRLYEQLQLITTIIRYYNEMIFDIGDESEVLKLLIHVFGCICP